MKKVLVLTLLVALSLASCDNFEYSPNQVFDSSTPRDLNAQNIEKLLNTTLNDDTVTIAFVGDSQRFYEEADDFVDKANSFAGVDFVILSGDITDFGLLNEYQWVHETFSRLNVPYVAVIGNHDVIANGDDVFFRMFGPLNYSFVYDKIKFVMHNTNGREYPTEAVPDMAWLRNEMQSENLGGADHVVAVSHVPPTDVDFNQSLVEDYAGLFATTPGFLVSLHGHIHEHTDDYPYDDGVRYITSFSFDQRSFLLLKIIDGNVTTETVNY